MTVTLFIATSLDGYIAGPDDDLSWLFTDADYGFSSFYDGVDALIMGRGTYEVVQQFGDWPYKTKKTVVVSRREGLETKTENTTIHSGDLPNLVDDLKEQGHDSVWLVGGGELVRSFLAAGLIDRITVSLHPVLLGKGIALFPGGFPKTMLVFEDSQAFETGLVQLNYHVLSMDDD